MCVQMWRLVDFSAILGCESTLTGIDGLARELQGPPGSDPRSWITGTAIGARDMDSGPHGCAASHLPRPATLENVQKDCPFSIHYYMVKTITSHAPDVGWDFLYMAIRVTFINTK